MEPPKAAESPSDAGRHICCSMTSVLVRMVRALKGEAAVHEMLQHADSMHSVEFLEDTDNWVSLDEAIALLDAGIVVTGDQQLARLVGADAVRQHAGTQVATLLRSLGSPEAVMSGITSTAAKFSTVTDMEAIETGPGRAVVRAVAREGFTRHPLLCDWTTGLLSTPCMLFGLPPARVEEVECQARGGHECRYVISWDEELAAAAIDPERRVTALEAQVVALARRLESAYATASDLVSPDDLDTVLSRIVARAANAVRAPGYVLAVRPQPDGELRVFSEGVSTEEAASIASDATDGENGEAVLCVDVASSRRDYGRLVAIHPAGMRFFPQERQLLALYAKHAAAVLDTALALEEASRRHHNVSALLALSQALAQAGTTEEVAARLSEAVSGVVDCDVASVWSWDDDAKCLYREATVGLRAAARRKSIAPGEAPHLDRMLREPQPMFFCDEAEDPALQAIMTDARLVALAVVPIIAREIFLGLLTVGVEQRPERLARSPELLEKLAGIAALAAPALQNGRLIDELETQVIQDGLTGALNRRGFSQLIEDVLATAAKQARCAGLLFVDLDGFKQLNDKYGHQFGDEVLCQVADRLRETFRDEDIVARLGGDEFAVVVPKVRSARHLNTAAKRAQTAFAEPFIVGGRRVALSACIGQALAPEHGTTIDALVRHADTAMYKLKDRARLVAVSEPSLVAQSS
jgi:diguanylate cyclase (GGDEF)-like protein